MIETAQTKVWVVFLSLISLINMIYENALKNGKKDI